MVDNKTLVALELVKKDLEKLLVKTNGKNNKKKEKNMNDVRKVLEEYPTIRDVDDAYGCGVISASKREKIISLMENKHIEAKTELDVYCTIIKNILKDINNEIKLG